LPGHRLRRNSDGGRELRPLRTQTGAIIPLSPPPVRLPRSARPILALATAFIWAPSSVPAQEPGGFFEMRPVVPGVWAAVLLGEPRPFAVRWRPVS
jgi:hypothetical protein